MKPFSKIKSKKARIIAYTIAVILILALIGTGVLYWLDNRPQLADPSFNARVTNPAYAADVHPKVLFDEAHKNFHTPSGRYKPFADLLVSDGYTLYANENKFSKDTLAGYDLLVIVNALGPDGHEIGSAFSDNEINAVHDWVQNGGNLLLIADHSPFGSAAKTLAERFGVEMFLRYAHDDKNSDQDPERLVFSRDNGLLPKNPISEGRNNTERLNRLVSFSGQSLTGPPGSTAILPLGDAAYDWESRKVRYPAAGHAQGLAFTMGKGRVVVLGEAAMLTAQLNQFGKPFGMNRPGSDDQQFALNIMHWLSGLLN